MPKEIHRDEVQRLVAGGAQLVEILPSPECGEDYLPAAICHDCQNRAFKQTVPQPHAHGG